MQFALVNYSGFTFTDIEMMTFKELAMFYTKLIETKEKEREEYEKALK